MICPDFNPVDSTEYLISPNTEQHDPRLTAKFCSSENNLADK